MRFTCIPVKTPDGQVEPVILTNTEEGFVPIPVPDVVIPKSLQKEKEENECISP